MKTVAAFLLIFASCAVADTSQERIDALPEIYKSLELESLEFTPSFRYRSFRAIDRQSIAVITSKRVSYLLVFEDKISPNPKVISFGGGTKSKFSGRVKAGRDRVCVYGTGGPPDCPRVLLIYKFADRNEENFTRDYLRGVATQTPVETLSAPLLDSNEVRENRYEQYVDHYESGYYAQGGGSEPR